MTTAPASPAGQGAGVEGLRSAVEAGTLTTADLGSHVTVRADKGYVVEGVLVLASHNATLGQTFIGVGAKPGGRQQRGIHIDPGRVVEIERAALAAADRDESSE